jgi:acetyl-CoA acetyltransferase
VRSRDSSLSTLRSVGAHTPTGGYANFCSAENTAKKLDISREEQDDYCIESYKRAQAAIDSGAFADEIVPVKLKKGEVTEDEEPKRIKLDKIRTLRTAFQKENGTITAANASSLNDGASAVVLSSKAKVDELGLKPLARIIGMPLYVLFSLLFRFVARFCAELISLSGSFCGRGMRSDRFPARSDTGRPASSQARWSDPR